jgi:hypothetical protein
VNLACKQAIALKTELLVQWRFFNSYLFYFMRVTKTLASQRVLGNGTEW